MPSTAERPCPRPCSRRSIIRSESIHHGVDSRAMSGAGLTLLQWLLVVPVIAGSAYSLACLAAMAVLRARARRAFAHAPEMAVWPPVSLLKPVYGTSRDLADNLRSA